jgi:DNA-3-methyladenine glycosylase II
VSPSRDRQGRTAALVTLTPRGVFSLRAAAEFGFGQNAGRVNAFDGMMRLAFAVDGGVGYAGAVLRQPARDGAVEVELELRHGADRKAALAQIERILSLDHDGEEFARVGERDPVIGRLQAAHPGQRPVLFHSPYEGSAWAIISARRPAAQAGRVRDGVAEQLGEMFELAGHTLHAFPQPDRLATLRDDTPGLNDTKTDRLRVLAVAALAGDLEPSRLHGLGPERAYVEIQRLPGIGPFYAGLVVLRASGFADAMLENPDPKLLAGAARLYDLDAPPSFGRLAEIAEPWRPFRTWVLVLIRLAGDRADG